MMEEAMRPQQTTKRAGQGEPTSRPPSPEDPGALLYTAEPYTYHEATWLGRMNVSGHRNTLDAFDAAFAHAPRGEDEWETMMRAAGAVRDVNEWYGRSIGRKGRRL